MIRRMPTRSLAVDRRSEARQRVFARIRAAVLLLLFAAVVRVPVALGKGTEAARVTSGPLTAIVGITDLGGGTVTGGPGGTLGCCAPGAGER